MQHSRANLKGKNELYRVIQNYWREIRHMTANAIFTLRYPNLFGYSLTDVGVVLNVEFLRNTFSEQMFTCIVKMLLFISILKALILLKWLIRMFLWNDESYNIEKCKKVGGVKIFQKQWYFLKIWILIERWHWENIN